MSRKNKIWLGPHACAQNDFLGHTITIHVDVQNIYYHTNLTADGVHISPHQYNAKKIM